MATLFISYSHKDAAWVDAFAASLSREGVTLWRDIDHIGPGQALPHQVSRAIDQAHGYCVVLSRESVQSWWVQTELGAAFTRRSRDPSFRLFPILLEDDCLPSILSGLMYIDGMAQGPESVGERIANGLHPQEQNPTTNIGDWGPLLSAIEADQFVEEPASHQYGGWSRSYSQNYLPLAFPGRVPDSVSQVDSITATHWVIRGLSSLKRLILRNRGSSLYLDRIEKRLSIARRYLIRHFDGRGAGLVHMTAMGERIHPDVRHSATFAKALLQLSHERLGPVLEAINFSLRDLSEGDGRAPTFAERLHLVGLLRGRCDLRPEWMTDSLLDEIQSSLEANLCCMAQECEYESGDAMLFGDEEQWHMSGYYSWWVLDACGDLLLRSSSARTGGILSNVHRGLRGLQIDHGLDGVSYPLTLHGGPDVGASAHIGEVLLRLWPVDHIVSIDSLYSWITDQIFGGGISDYKHTELLWSVPQFFERIQTTRCEAG